MVAVLSGWSQDPVARTEGGLLRPGDAAESLALLELLDVPGLGSKRAFDRLTDAGGARAALARVSAPQASKSLEGHSRGEVARRRLEVLDRLGIHLMAPWSEGYPSHLGDLHDPPVAIFARGDVSLLTRPAVAIVGSRKASSYGRRCAEKVARACAKRGIVVVSGLAMGIDGAAHRATLDASGNTVAVLGNGVDAVHPKSNARLGMEIVRRGLMISEYPPGVGAQPYHFPQRNRIIAALARAVIVVEAARRSGALITVDHALDLGRDVYGVPGPIDQSTHVGVNAMLRDGAGVLDDPESFATSFAEGVGLFFTSSLAPVAGIPLEPKVARVLGAIETGACTAEALRTALKLETAETLVMLTELELGGWVKQDADLRFRRA